MAEDSYHSRTSAFVLEQPDQMAYLIVDEAHMQMPEMPLIKFIDGWETVEEMEAALGIPEGKLAATLNRYNEYAAKGEDPDFHKQPEYVAPQDKGPWAAFDLSLGGAMYSGLHHGRACGDGRRRGAARGRQRDSWALRRGCLRVEYRAGRQGLCQRNPAGRGLVLRPPRRSARRSAG